MKPETRERWMEPEVEIIDLRQCWHLLLPWTWDARRLVKDRKLGRGPFIRNEDGTVDCFLPGGLEEFFGITGVWIEVMNQIRAAVHELGQQLADDLHIHLVGVWGDEEVVHAAVYFSEAEPQREPQSDDRVAASIDSAVQADARYTRWENEPKWTRGPRPPLPRREEFIKACPVGRWVQLSDGTEADALVLDDWARTIGESYASQPSDGRIRLTLLQTGSGGTGGIVQFTERGERPQYTEVRRAVEAQTPSAFSSPRRTDVAPPDRTMAIDADEIYAARNLSEIFEPEDRQRGLWEDLLATPVLQEPPTGMGQVLQGLGIRTTKRPGGVNAGSRVYG